MQKEALAEATETYEMELDSFPEAFGYLLGRGLEPQTVRSFRLGGVRDPLPAHASQRGRIAIPYLGRDDKPLQLRFRCFEEHDHTSQRHGKYNTVSGDPARLFNVRAIARADTEIHLAEGEFDAMILEQCGFHAVAVPGANSWKPHWRRMLLGFQRIYIWADPDEAGAELVNKASRGLSQARAVRLERDVTDTYLAEGREGLLERVRKIK